MPVALYVLIDREDISQPVCGVTPVLSVAEKFVKDDEDCHYYEEYWVDGIEAEKGTCTDYMAFTSQKNTPQSDMLNQVWHTVTYNRDGVAMERRILAECPMDAIKKCKEKNDG